MEETIKEIKEKIINPFYEFPNPRSIELKCKDSDLILDLIKEYQKLKMQLEVEKIDNKYNQEEASEEMIPRYKIREKIKWYEEACKHLLKNGIDLDRYDQYQGAIEALQELLEESE